MTIGEAWLLVTLLLAFAEIRFFRKWEQHWRLEATELLRLAQRAADMLDERKRRP